MEATMTAADHGEYLDWAYTNTDSNWSINIATFLLAATNASSFTNEDPPLYLDSGVLTHISCVWSNFLELRQIEPQNILGVGNSLVAATGMGTIEILIHETSTHLTLCNILYTPNAGMHLISISHLDDSGYELSFTNGICNVLVWSSGRKLTECTQNSSGLYVFSSSIQSCLPTPLPSTSTPCTAFSLLTAKPNLEMWHWHLGHANFCTIFDMARGDITAGMQGKR